MNDFKHVLDWRNVVSILTILLHPEGFIVDIYTKEETTQNSIKPLHISSSVPTRVHLVKEAMSFEGNSNFSTVQ